MGGPSRSLALLGRPGLVNESGAHSHLMAKDAALLALLVIEGPTERAKIAAWLWPEVDAARARGNLRQRILRLRSFCAEVVQGGEILEISPKLRVDWREFGTDELTHPFPQGLGALIAGLQFPGCEEFEEWLADQRERWRERQMETIAKLAQHLEARGDLDAAVMHRKHLVREDPLNEHHQRALIRLHGLRRDRPAALAAFKCFLRRLDSELGVDADRDTHALVAQIRYGTFRT